MHYDLFAVVMQATCDTSVRGDSVRGSVTGDLGTGDEQRA